MLFQFIYLQTCKRKIKRILSLNRRGGGGAKPGAGGRPISFLTYGFSRATGFGGGDNCRAMLGTSSTIKQRLEEIQLSHDLVQLPVWNKTTQGICNHTALQKKFTSIKRLLSARTTTKQNRLLCILKTFIITYGMGGMEGPNHTHSLVNLHAVLVEEVFEHLEAWGGCGHGLYVLRHVFLQVRSHPIQKVLLDSGKKIPTAWYLVLHTFYIIVRLRYIEIYEI